MVWKDSNPKFISSGFFALLTVIFAIFYFILKLDHLIYGLLFYTFAFLFTIVFLLTLVKNIFSSPKKLIISDNSFILPDGSSYQIKEIKSVCFWQAERIVILNTDEKHFKLFIEKRNKISTSYYDQSRIFRIGLWFKIPLFTYGAIGQGVNNYFKIRKLVAIMKKSLPTVQVKDSSGLMNELNTIYPKNSVKEWSRIYSK